MRMEYSPDGGALYVRLRAGEVAETVELDELVYADLDADGAPLGVEFVAAADLVPFLARRGGALDVMSGPQQLLRQWAGPGQEDRVERPRVAAHVHSFGSLSHAEVAPLLDALQARCERVSTEAYTPDGSGRAGGFSVDLNLVLSIVGPSAAIFVKELLGELAGDTYAGLRRAFSDLGREEPGSGAGGQLRSFSIIIGGLRFVHDAPVTNDTLVASFKAAQALADTLPDDLVNNPEGPGGFFYTWDRASKTWQGPHHP